MYLLRRTAVKALSSSASYAVKPRSVAAVRPFAIRQQSSVISPFQRKFYSTEEARPSEAETTDETVSETTSKQAEDSSAPESADAQDQATIASAIEQATETVKSTVASVAETATAAAERAGDVLSNAGDAAATPFTSRSRPLPPVSPNTLYVGNLSYDITDDQLRRIFSKFGEVQSAVVTKDATGRARGFGFVKFRDEKDAAAAVENLHLQQFEGRRIAVQVHQPKDRNTSRPSYQTQRAAREPNSPTNTLFIGNMSYEMSDKDLNELFRDIRNVLDVRVAIDRRTGQPRGFAHADFVDVASAQRAMEQLQGKEIYGRPLRIDYSTHTRETTRPGNVE